ncbi:hypothetical protein OSTOST_17643, partial [Ostertagia ostertagi]
VLSIFLFYWSGIYCRYNRCGESLIWPEKNRQYAQYFPIFTAPLIAMISLAWLVTNVCYSNTPCAIAYNCMADSVALSAIHAVLAFALQ